MWAHICGHHTLPDKIKMAPDRSICVCDIWLNQMGYVHGMYTGDMCDVNVGAGTVFGTV